MATRETPTTDRVGLGWRPELAAGILTNTSKIDIVEIIAEDYFDAGRDALRGLKTLASQIPVVLHGVSLGMASAAPVDMKRVDCLAQLVAALEPEFWSEHLAFVRGGGIEIGHLAAPPRTEATVAGAARNLAAAGATVGARPLVENIATLIAPPASTLDEGDWIAAILAASDCDLLLDLHNLYANGVNFDFDPLAVIDRLPVERIRAIHIAGGKWISAKERQGKRLLDDHLHDVPNPVYALLTETAKRVPHPLTVILERDGDYPAMEVLLDQLDRARDALATGRAARVTPEAVR